MKLFSVLSILALLIMVGCSDSGDSPTAPDDGGNNGGGGVDTVSFATDIRPIIQSNGCLGGSCHGSGSSQGGLSLGTATYNDIRNASGDHGAIISAGNSSGSNLYLKVTTSPPFGSRMPVGGALTTDQINKIRDWIDQGALNN